MPPKVPPSTPRQLRPLFRKFLLSVHPDLFSDSPVISKQNEESLQIVLPFFNSIFSPANQSPPPDYKSKSAGHVVTFHVKRSSTKDSENGSSAGVQTSAVRFTLHGHSMEAKILSVSKL
jgi:hypothetical protein